MSNYQPFKRTMHMKLLIIKPQKKNTATEGMCDNTKRFPINACSVSQCSPKFLSLAKVITTNFHMNTMIRQMNGNLGKYKEGEAQMLKPDVGVDPWGTIL